MIVLDTNVVSELMRGKPNANVVRWVNRQGPTDLYLTSVSQAEILYGIQLLPKGKRRRKPQPEPPPQPERRFLLPRFLPSFYKSLEGKDRRAVEKAIQAVLLFCTEGHAYPGLEVKQLGGQDTWSLRASLGLRVYFRPLPDGEIELLERIGRELAPGMGPDEVEERVRHLAERLGIELAVGVHPTPVLGVLEDRFEQGAVDVEDDPDSPGDKKIVFRTVEGFVPPPMELAEAGDA